SHHCRARWPQARPGVRHRVDDRPQARRVRPDPHVPGSHQGRPPRSPRLMPRTSRDFVTVTSKGNVMATAANTPAGASAAARHVRVAPMKTRRVVDLIRGLPANEALNVLRFAPQSASEPVYKVLASAIANAEHNEGLKAD